MATGPEAGVRRTRRSSGHVRTPALTMKRNVVTSALIGLENVLVVVILLTSTMMGNSVV